MENVWSYIESIGPVDDMYFRESAEIFFKEQDEKGAKVCVRVCV